MFLQQSSTNTLQSLQALIEQLPGPDYARPLKILSGSSVGKHIRHILEFYECLFQGLPAGKVDYDARQRDLRLETDREFSLETIASLIGRMKAAAHDAPLRLQVYTEPGAPPVYVCTTLYRELVYNIEHCVHHLALVRIAVGNDFPGVVLPDHFGVAPATIRCRQAAH